MSSSPVPPSGKRLADVNLVGVVACQGVDYVATVLELLEQGAVVATLSDAGQAERLQISGVKRVVQPRSGGGWLRNKFVMRETEALAMVTFTSGTTAGPKGVLLTHANLADTVHRLTAVMSIDGSIREYLGTPVFHAFGFGRCRTVLHHGGSIFVPDGGFNPAEIARMLAGGEINALSMVPTLARVLLANRHLFGVETGQMRWIEIGSQYMSRAEKEAIRALFPNARIVHQYGLTEASRSTILVISEHEGPELESVGRAVGRTEIKIDESMCIAIRGPHVTSTLLIDGAEVSAIDEDNWFHTSDQGEIVDGFLYYKGRADDLINSGGHKISPDLLEHELRTRLGVGSEIAVARVPDVARGEGVLIAVRDVCEIDDARVREVALQALREVGANIGSSLHLLRLPEFPMTSSGKVKRKALTETFVELVGRQSGVSESAPDGVATNSETLAIRELFSRTFRSTDLGPGDSFVSLGGDSLTFVAASVQLERLLGQLPANWQNMTLAELESIEQFSPGRRRWHYVDTTLLVRFVGIIAVVVGHFTPLPIGGATYLLLLVAGLNFGRFQVPHVLATESVKPILATAGKIAAPLFLLILATHLRHLDFEIENLLLLGNWEPALTQQTDLWFLELLVQVFLLMALLFAWPKARSSAKQSPWLLSGGLLSLSVAAAVLVPRVWPTEVLYDRVPHMMLWLFALGWVVQAAKSTLQKGVAIALAVALPMLVWDLRAPPVWVCNAHAWLALGCPLLLFFDRLPVPYPIDRLSYWIGGSSMFIYMLHGAVVNTFYKLTGVDTPLVSIALGIAAGVLGWISWDLIMAALALRRRSRSGACDARSSSAAT